MHPQLPFDGLREPTSAGPFDRLREPTTAGPVDRLRNQRQAQWADAAVLPVVAIHAIPGPVISSDASSGVT